MSFQAHEIFGLSREHTITPESGSATIKFTFCPDKTLESFLEQAHEDQSILISGLFGLYPDPVTLVGDKLEFYEDKRDRVILYLMTFLIPTVYTSYTIIKGLDQQNEIYGVTVLGIERITIRQETDEVPDSVFGRWSITATYGSSKNIDQCSLSIQPITTTEKVTQSLKTDGVRTVDADWIKAEDPYTTGPDTKLAIGATRTSVEGTTVHDSETEIRLTAWYKSSELYSSINTAQVGLLQHLQSLKPFTNLYEFLGFEPGEVLYKTFNTAEIPVTLMLVGNNLGIVSSIDAFRYVPVTFVFRAGRNPGLIGNDQYYGPDPTGWDDGLKSSHPVRVEAHDHIDYRYIPTESNKDMVLTPQYRRIHIMYLKRDFVTELQIPCLVGP